MSSTKVIKFEFSIILCTAFVTRERRAGAPILTSRLGEEFLGKRCTYAVEDEEEALARAEDSSIPGSVVNVTDLEAGEELVERAHVIFL